MATDHLYEDDPVRIRPHDSAWISRRALPLSADTDASAKSLVWRLGLAIVEKELVDAVSRAIRTGCGLVAVAPDDSEHLVVSQASHTRGTWTGGEHGGPCLQPIADVPDLASLVMTITNEAYTNAILGDDEHQIDTGELQLQMNGATIGRISTDSDDPSISIPIRARGCLFASTVNIQSQPFSGSIELYNCIFADDLICISLDISNAVRLDDCTFMGIVVLDRVTFSHHVYATNSRFAEEVNLSEVSARAFRWTGSIFAEILVMESVSGLRGSPMYLSRSLFRGGIQYESPASHDAPIDISDSIVHRSAVISGDLRALDTRGVRIGTLPATLSGISQVKNWSDVECRSEDSRRRKGWRRKAKWRPGHEQRPGYRRWSA